MGKNQYVCRICGNSQNNRAYNVKEMMFGFGNEFTYFECTECEAFQIVRIPKNLGKYYPKTYYSFNLDSYSPLKQFLRNRLANYLVLKNDIVGKILSWFFYDSRLSSIGMIERINRTSKILDVGCGKGQLLYILRDIGFKNLYGVDPYIVKDMIEEGVTIWKRTIYEVPELEFELIMFHHSLEHMVDQLDVLKQAKRLLSGSGIILIRMPVKSEYIWSKYGVNWVQIDAPRHVIIHTLKSFEMLSKKAGLKIEKVVFDSTAFQFWGSEMYKRDIPLNIGKENLRTYFNYKQIKKWEKKAKELNQTQQGDQAIFYLKKLKK